MKINNTLLVLLVSVFTLPAFAQTGQPETKTLNTLSVKNSDGELVSSSNDTISRSFFSAPEVTVLSTQPVKSDERFTCVLQPKDGGESKAYFLGSATFPADLKKWLENASAGTLVTFTVTNKDACYPKSQSYALQIVLK